MVTALTIFVACAVWHVIGLLILAMRVGAWIEKNTPDAMREFMLRHRWCDIAVTMLLALVMMGPFGLVHMVVMEMVSED